MSRIESLEELRALYRDPSERAVKKELSRLDRHCRRFLELARLVIISTHDADGRADASPRGGESGFIKARDERILIPDRPGNNRLDSMSNILETGRIGLLFLIPGVNEVLRVNGRAWLETDAALLELCTEQGRAPKLVIMTQVEEAYLHCAKALMRARLWSADVQVERSVLPTMGEMLKEQTGAPGPPESEEAMLERYRAMLY